MSSILFLLPNKFLNASISAAVRTFGLDGIHNLQRLVQWLTEFPLGLKLNRPLGRFLGNMISSTVDIWLRSSSAVRQLLPSSTFLFQLVGFFFGFSLQLALLFDLFQFITFQVFYVCLIFGRILGFFFSSLRSLWLLFQGKKWNVLRHRVDTSIAELDQMLTGTILFTIVAFLTPTVAAFYYSCLPLWIGILCLQIISIAIIIVTFNIPMFFLFSFTSSSLTDGPIYQTLNSLLSTESLQRLCVGSPVYWFQKSPPINFMLLSPTLPDVDPVKLYSTWNEWIETRGNNQYLGHKRK